MQWMQWMNKKKKQHWGNFFFYLPASIHCIVCFFFFTPLVKKWLKEWLTAEIRPLASPRAHSGTHTHAHKTLNSSFMFYVRGGWMWRGAIWRAQFPWQQVWGLGWKTVMPEQLSEHLESEEHLRVKGRRRGRGWRWENLGRLEGSREERGNG